MVWDTSRKTIERKWFRSFLLTKYSILRKYESDNVKELWCVYLQRPEFNYGHAYTSKWLKRHGFVTTNPKMFDTEEEATDYFTAMAGILMLADGPKEEVGSSGAIQKNPVA